MQAPQTDRRRMLRLAAAGAVTLWLPRSAWSQPRLREQPVHAGRGQRRAHATTAWCCGRGWCTPACSAARAAMRRSRCAGKWRTTRPSRASRRRARRRRSPELAHSVHVEARGLETDRWLLLSLHARRRGQRLGQPGGAHAHLARSRRGGRAPAPGLRLVPALGARLLQRLAPPARRRSPTRWCSWATTSTSTPARPTPCARPPAAGCSRWTTTASATRCTRARPTCRPRTPPAPGS